MTLLPEGPSQRLSRVSTSRHCRLFITSGKSCSSLVSSDQTHATPALSRREHIAAPPARHAVFTERIEWALWPTDRCPYRINAVRAIYRRRGFWRHLLSDVRTPRRRSLSLLGSTPVHSSFVILSSRAYWSVPDLCAYGWQSNTCIIVTRPVSTYREAGHHVRAFSFSQNYAVSLWKNKEPRDNKNRRFISSEVTIWNLINKPEVNFIPDQHRIRTRGIQSVVHEK